MRYLTLAEVVDLHRLITRATGGGSGIRDLGALESAIGQPKATFDTKDLYPSLIDKAAVLCFSIVQAHSFVDGNKGTGHAAMSTFLFLNGVEIDATIDEQEQIMLALASGHMNHVEIKRSSTHPSRQIIIRRTSDFLAPEGAKPRADAPEPMHLYRYRKAIRNAATANEMATLRIA